MPNVLEAPVSAKADRLEDSTPLLDRRDDLLARWKRDGALYFRQVIDPEAIAAVRNTYMEQLQVLGLVADGETQPIWTGGRKVDGKRASPVADGVWQGLVRHPSFDRVIRTFLGEAPSWVPIVVHRTTPPLGVPAHGDIYQGRHQDGPFNFGIGFITCWVPLMDIDDAVGGLAVAPGSHTRSYHGLSQGEIPTYASPIAPGLIADDQWVRPDYRIGDMLMFHGMTAHAGLPNASDRFRLSIDVRYIPSSEAEPIVGIVDGFDGSALNLVLALGDRLRFEVDQDTMVRGPKGLRVIGEELTDVLFEGAEVIAIPDREGHARLIRSVSRKYVDLPASWFSELLAGWVG